MPSISEPYPPLLSKPSKPLKILTIDGGGLQAIATLTILDKLLDAIAQNNDVGDRRPRPCDVFDCIAGIGAGGWLALLLGRFHLDITACLAEWYNITHCIAPQSKSEELRRRLFQQCYFDTDRLIDQIEELTEIYETGPNLVYNDPDGPRCSHVFVAALKTNAKGHSLKYNLFRTYLTPKGAKVLEGPENPSSFKISRAFAATGAAKYFTPLWKEHMEKGALAKFSNDGVKKIHNISELALDEMWGLYGKDVPISVVINIGPGIPGKADIKQIAKRFSWGIDPAKQQQLPKRARSPATQDLGPNQKRVVLAPRNEKESTQANGEHRRDSRVRFPGEISNQENTQSYDRNLDSLVEDDPKRPMDRTTTFGSVVNRDVNQKLKRQESEIENDIKLKLKNVYPHDTPPYYRLAPETSPTGTTRNDASHPARTYDATTRYLGSPSTETLMDEASRRLRSDGLIAVC